MFSQAELTNQVTGEEPINKSTPNIVAYAGRYKASTIPILQSKAAKFQLPSNLQKVLRETNSISDCYEAQVINFKQNPYMYGASAKSEVINWVSGIKVFLQAYWCALFLGLTYIAIN